MIATVQVQHADARGKDKDDATYAHDDSETFDPAHNLCP
jgi:hypothetical protein